MAKTLSNVLYIGIGGFAGIGLVAFTSSSGLASAAALQAQQAAGAVATAT